MSGHALASGDLIISRAAVSGPAARKVDLGQSLSRLHIADITIGDEILIIPQLRCRTRLSRAMPASHFAAGLTNELRHIRHDALIDPTYGVPGPRAFRFTSHDRYAAWLVHSWLRPVSAHARQILSVLLRGEAAEHWQRRHILNDGRRIVRLVRALALQESAVLWTARLSPVDCESAIQALGWAYGFRPAPREVADQKSERRSGVSAQLCAADAIRSVSSSLTVAGGISEILEIKLRRVVRSYFARQENALADLSTDQQTVVLTSLLLAETPNLGPSLDLKDFRALVRYVAVASMPPTAASSPVGADDAVAPDELPQAKLATNEKPKQSPTAPRPAYIIAKLPGDPAPVPSLNRVNRMSARPAPADISWSPATQPHEHLASRGIYTEFGGLLFVINILLALKLYPDFTMPLGKRLDPSPFWLLAQIGVQLFGRPFRRDPLFGLLLDAGQPGRLPTVWQVEREWLGGMPCSGFALRRFDAAPKPWSRQAIRATAIGGRRATSTRVADGNARWLMHLAAFIRFRIAQAAPGLDVSKLRISASAKLTDDSLDLYFALAKLPLAIRMAGLDRNPGWLPSEGRSMSFHFN